MIHLLIAVTGILLLAYAILIFFYHRIWDRIPVSAEPLLSGKEAVRVTVIIPARNEAANIGNCLDCLLLQNYPAGYLEVIVVNDFSSDQTAALVLSHPLKCRLLNLSDFVSGTLNAYKKKAIETGISHASGEMIVCTDADCTMGADWIAVLATAFQKYNRVFLAAPVKILSDHSALSVFQALDFISLQGITGAATFRNLYPMCNGANLAYSKKAFNDVNGFSDIDHIASGDDMLLMKKIQTRFTGQTGYVKDPRAIVNTRAAENIRDFFSQRIRWASKISHYRHPATFLTLAMVYLLNLGLLILFFCCLFYGQWRWFILLIALKTISEYFFVSKVAAFFNQQFLMKYFILCQPFHIAYTVIAGSFGSFGRYEWKNRKVK